jgi:hypothetical protein
VFAGLQGLSQPSAEREPKATEQPLDEAAAQPAATTAEPAAASKLQQDRAGQQQFDLDVNTARTAAARAAGGAAFLQPGDDAWAHELEAIERELSQFESETGFRSR